MKLEVRERRKDPSHTQTLVAGVGMVDRSAGQLPTRTAACRGQVDATDFEINCTNTALNNDPCGHCSMDSVACAHNHRIVNPLVSKFIYLE
jgi:hypothetical protein